MDFRSLFIFLIFNSIAGSIFSQSFSISGKVVDSETNEPLQFAHVFIDQTTHGTISDVNGEFFLENLNAGEYRLVFSFVGFKLYNRSVSISDKNIIVNARLVSNDAVLQNIEVSGTKDKEWEKRLKDFKRFFLGEDEFAKDCKILNPWFIDFNYDKATQRLTATASQPIEIENKALGYLINCSLQNFEFTPGTFKIKGLYRFTEMEATNVDEAKRWTANRSVAYQRSLPFFFKSMVNNDLKSNGFDVFVDKRPNMYVLNSGYFSDELGKRVFKPDLNRLIIPYTTPGIFKLMSSDRLEVHHLNAYAQSKAYRDLSCPVSWIEFANGFVLVSKDGIVVNKEDVISVGKFNSNRISSMLPLNYNPGRIVVVNYLTKVNVALRLQERIYAHMDRAFYNPGGKIKYKVYESAATESIRDSLSRVVYVEVIDKSKNIKQSQKIQLSNNEAAGEIDLPADWEPGIYYLRVYTNWMRNYGVDNIFVTPICISSFNQQIFSTRKEKPGGDFIISIPEQIPTAEDFELTIQLDSASVTKWSSSSISICEANVAIFPFAPDITQSLEFPKMLADDALVESPHSLEYSMVLNGRFIHPKNKHVITELTVLRGTMDSVYHIKTDKNGYFKIENLNFFDSLTFSFQAKNKKGRIFGSTILIPVSSPEVVLPTINTSTLDTVVTSLIVEKIDKPVAEAKPVEKVEREKLITTSHASDIVISREMLDRMPAKQGILDVLQGAIPGFQINSNTGRITLRGFNRTSNSEPLIVVDGLPYFQTQPKSIPQQSNTQSATQSSQNPRSSTTTAASQTNQNTQDQSSQVRTESALSSFGYLTTADISRIEISTQSDSRYGYAGIGGVISIYTRKVFGNEANIKTFDIYKLMGYSNTKMELGINDDQQAHILPYWNSSFTISSLEQKKIRLHAPKKPGLYMINMAGMSEEGNPLHMYYYFQVN